MDDVGLTSRWSDSSSSEEEFVPQRPSVRRRNTTGQASSTQPKKEKVPLHRRIASKFKLKKGSRDKTSLKAVQTAPDLDLHLQGNPYALAIPTHLPIAAQYTQPSDLAHRIKSQENLLAKHRTLRGPVPRQPPPGVDPRFANKDATALREQLDFLFLAPCEKKVLFLLRETQPASRFRPLLEPQNELLLVKTADYDKILETQQLVRELPDDERQLMWSNLHGQLLAHQFYILRLVLFNPEIRITTHTRGSGVESPEPVGRPDTNLFFSQVQELSKADPKKIRWEQTPEASHSSRALALVKRKKSAPRLRLRGGGEEHSWRSLRSLRTYHNHAQSSRAVQRLEDEERAPMVLWWLAGGNNRRGRKIPTGSELRARRAAEKENRQSVGFIGTVLGVRSRKSHPREALAGKIDGGEEPQDVAPPTVPDSPREVDAQAGSPSEVSGDADDDSAAITEAPRTVDAAIEAPQAGSEVDATEAVEKSAASPDRVEGAGETTEAEETTPKGDDPAAAKVDDGAAAKD